MSDFEKGKEEKLETKTSFTAVSRKSLGMDVSENLVLAREEKPKKPVQEELEFKNENLIPNLESAFKNFEKLIPKDQLSPAIQKNLDIIFQYMYKNFGNSDKNANRIFRMHKESDQFTLKDVDFFMYYLYEFEGGDKASFNGAQRTMYLDEKFDPENFLDMLIFVHELIHAAQDNALRTFISSEEYQNLYTRNPDGSKNKIIDHESQAWAFQIEITNALLGGDLKETVLNGKILDENWVIKKLKANVQQKDLVRQVLNLAKIYYKKGVDENAKPDSEFTRAIFNIYKSDPGVYYTFNEQGKLVKYK